MFIRHSGQQGAGLIEVLIAVLIIAVGLIGFSGIQTQAMRMNYETLQRARASAMAEDILDRMRSNREQATTSETYLRDFGDDLPTVDTKCDVEVCTAPQMARWDLKNWMEILQSAAPGADAEITRPNAADPNYIKVSIRLVEVSEIKLTDLTDIANDQLVNFDFYTVL